MLTRDYRAENTLADFVGEFGANRRDLAGLATSRFVRVRGRGAEVCAKSERLLGFRTPVGTLLFLQKEEGEWRFTGEVEICRGF